MAQGKFQPIHVFTELCTPDGSLAAVGKLRQTLENLPARVAATELRNYVLGHLVEYRGIVKNTALVPISVSAREIHRSFGNVKYKDLYGVVVSSMEVDKLTAMNLRDGHVAGKMEAFIQAGRHIGAGEVEEFRHFVLIPYSPAFASIAHRPHGRADRPMAASMLGKEANFEFTNCGANIGPVEYQAPVEVTVVALCHQSKELIAPSPVEIREALLGLTNDPYIDEGEARKLEQVTILSDKIGTVGAPVILGGFTSDDNLQVDVDGRIVLDGPAQRLVRAIDLSRPVECLTAAGLGGGVYNQDTYGGECYGLIDQDVIEKETGAEACTRLTIRGLRNVEGREDVDLLMRLRYNCPSRLFNRWADREGISAEDRKQILIGGAKAAAVGLTEGEAIGVERTVGTRKDRR